MSKLTKIEYPYCTCSKGRMDGYRNIGNGIWAHNPCGKPSRLYWEKTMLIDRYWQELDEIVDRIITKQELPDGLDKGRAETAALFIAILLRPHAPEIKDVRDTALRRYRSRGVTGN